MKNRKRRVPAGGASQRDADANGIGETPGEDRTHHTGTGAGAVTANAHGIAIREKP